MHDDDRMFHDARDAVEFSLGRAFADIEDARNGSTYWPRSSATAVRSTGSEVRSR